MRRTYIPKSEANQAMHYWEDQMFALFYQVSRYLNPRTEPFKMYRGGRITVSKRFAHIVTATNGGRYGRV